jgi:thiol-disulfide isomerase/thioredoxin
VATALLLVAAACSSASPTTSTSSSLDTQPPSSTTTTEAPPGTIDTTTTSTTDAPIPEYAPTLVVYLAELYVLDGDLVMATVRSNAIAATDPLSAFLQTAGSYGEGAARLRAIAPPPGTAELHEAKLAVLERQVELIEPAVAAVDAGDQAAFQEAIGAYVGGLSELLAAGLLADGIQADKASEVLDERGEAAASYIAAVLRLRTSQGTTALGELVSAAVQGDTEALAELGLVLEELSDGYAAFDPPPEYEGLHARQVALLAGLTGLIDAISAAVSSGEPIDPDAVQAVATYSSESPLLNADWSYAAAVELHPEIDSFEHGTPEVEGDLSAMPQGAGIDETATGEPSPTVIGRDFAGNEVRIEHDGRAKAIVFLAHWCPHCQAEVPRVQAWLDETGGVEGVDIYSVSTALNPSRPNYPPSAWLESELWTVPLIRDDAESNVYRAFGAGGFPFWVFVNADGTVAGRVSGETTIHDLEALLTTLATN